MPAMGGRAPDRPGSASGHKGAERGGGEDSAGPDAAERTLGEVGVAARPSRDLPWLPVASAALLPVVKREQRPFEIRLGPCASAARAAVPMPRAAGNAQRGVTPAVKAPSRPVTHRRRRRLRARLVSRTGCPRLQVQESLRQPFFIFCTPLPQLDRQEWFRAAAAKATSNGRER